MKDERSSKEKNHTSPKDKAIHIVGPRRLQNDLMAQFLAKETGSPCYCGEDLSRFSVKDGKGLAQKRLVLLDCLGKDPENCIALVESGQKMVLSGAHIVLFNVKDGMGIEQKALDRGVKGFFYEQDPLELLPKGVRAVFSGELWVSREIMAKCIMSGRGKEMDLPKSVSTILTAREIEILSMVAMGVRNEDIAKELFISPNTVKTHVYNIFKKINVPNRLQAALWAAKNL